MDDPAVVEPNKEHFIAYRNVTRTKTLLHQHLKLRHGIPPVESLRRQVTTHPEETPVHVHQTFPEPIGRIRRVNLGTGRPRNTTTKLVVPLRAGIVPGAPVGLVQCFGDGHSIHGHETVVGIHRHGRDRQQRIVFFVRNGQFVGTTGVVRGALRVAADEPDACGVGVGLDQEGWIAVFGESSEGVAGGLSEDKEGVGVGGVGHDEEGAKGLLVGQVGDADSDDFGLRETILAAALASFATLG